MGKSIPSGILLERFLCFSNELDVNVLFQGEDISGPLVTSSGNETRMLGFRLASVLTSNADIIVSGFVARAITCAGLLLPINWVWTFD